MEKTRQADVTKEITFMGVRLVASNANNVRIVNSDGTLNNNNAYNGTNGVRPIWRKVRSSKSQDRKQSTATKGSCIPPDLR